MHQAGHVRQLAPHGLQQVQKEGLARAAVQIDRQPQRVRAAGEQGFLAQLGQRLRKGPHGSQHPQHSLFIPAHGRQHGGAPYDLHKAGRIGGQKRRGGLHVGHGGQLGIAAQLGGQHGVQRGHMAGTHHVQHLLDPGFHRPFGVQGGVGQGHIGGVDQRGAAVSGSGRHRTSLLHT